MKSSFATHDLLLLLIHKLYVSCEEVDRSIRTSSRVFLDLPHLLSSARNMEAFLLSRTLPVRKTAKGHGAHFDLG